MVSHPPAGWPGLAHKRPNRLVIDVYRIQIVKVTKDLGNGLAYTFWQDDMSGLPVRIYALTLAPDSRYELRPFSGAGAVNGRGRLAKAVAANGARAAVNACYFDTDGWVIGNCKWDGSSILNFHQNRQEINIFLPSQKRTFVREVS